MDDLQREPQVPETHDERNQKELKSTNLLRLPSIKRQCKESGFHETMRLSLKAIRDAVLHHRWEEARPYLDAYIQTLEDTTTRKQLLGCQIVWRLCTEIFWHHPNKDMESFNELYEVMKNTGVKNYAEICLEHAFHLMLNGDVLNAKRQLSVAMSWRYGKQSDKQSLELKLIHAYYGFLDYLIWTTKQPSSISEAEEGRNDHEMHNYFRQASVTLQEIIKQPGVWDPFVCGYIEMLEYYNAEEEAVELLQNYAYNQDFPANPNAHVYLYKHLKKRRASPQQLINALQELHKLVPSHELMLKYCDLLMKSEKQENLQHALSVIMNLLEHASWKTDVNAWTRLLQLVKCFCKRGFTSLVKEEWKIRQDLWLKMHFKRFQRRKDYKHSTQLMRVKIKVLKGFGVYDHHYSAFNFRGLKKKRTSA